MASRFDSYMILSDLDGTFFGENSEILPRNVAAISDFTKSGGLFTFATGRDFKVLGQQFPELFSIASCPGVLCNGAYLYDFQTSTCMDEICLDQNAILKVMDLVAKEIPGASFRISSTDGFLCSDTLPLPFPAKSYEKLKSIIFRGDLAAFRHLTWHKLVYSAAGEGVHNFIPELKRLLEGLDLADFVVTTSSPTLLEILPKGVSKSRGVQMLKSRYPERTVICVGDYENDRDMLLAANLAACPGNALDSIKQISQIHLCHHRDGCLADLIDKLDSGNNQSILEE